MNERIVYSVIPMPAHHGKTTRYAIAYRRGGNNFVLQSDAGRLRSFATNSGAQRECDRLNALEHKRISG
jgi:hypothetical protein